MPRHRHRDPYISVTLTGGFIEAGDSGRWRARPGTVLIHGANEAHQDIFDRATTVLNLPCPSHLTSTGGWIEDVDAVVRLAARDMAAASRLVTSNLVSAPAQIFDWPDLLARDLRVDPSLSLADWAAEKGLRAPSVSRGFYRTFGVSPQRFRLEARAHQAMRAIVSTQTALAEIAIARGFADQAHMTRAISAITGAPPRELRRGQATHNCDGLTGSLPHFSG